MVRDCRPSAPTMEFHVARDARDRYRFEESLYSITGNVIIANFHAARQFAHRMNQKRDLVSYPEQAVKASQVNAMALIHELTHYMFRSYIEQVNPKLLSQTLAYLESSVGKPAVDTALHTFASDFPTLAVYRRQQTVDDYLAGESNGTPNREIVLEEMLMLWLENSNPAFAPFMELFDDLRLEKETSYPAIMTNLYNFFGGVARDTGAGTLGGGLAGVSGGQNLIDILRAPALASPHSLEGQLEFMRGRWGVSLGRYFYRLLGSLDLIKEENKPVFFGPPGPIETPAQGFAGLEIEAERFSEDREWMPRLVLLAKNAYVWLDQLAKQYDRPINTLDQVPDEELDKLQRWGVTGLWLIGLWERSIASARIKQIMGNSDAVASAYSLYDYQIANKLGGESAAQNLRERAWKRGIRLSSDMVPNHVGIDGRWVVENPEWFISVNEPPYPAYSFNGPNLSNDERVGIFLEDHYYDRSDASVVFKRVDNWSGDTRYIYHGNDGTSMPWNDTAQLDYLNPQVREVVIQTILHVARQFPVIRFDAAMTLAKRHIQRLWYPEPGSGGAIASRSEHALTKAQFEAAIPEEFWREVVDRVAAEVPDTLLLAEAFWMMEGYFVRTLGMHRVYNSAFMHMTRDENNAKHRSLIKETLEFDPEILKRYVNFQSNPDERTAIDQYGKDDKYFGVCTLMLTLPGLPMLGHGQIEGFAEKYGMEYQRSYWNEEPDQYLIERHEREIFPLMHKRYLFAGVEHFLLYDFFTTDGGVNEDVYAYSNRFGDERSLVIFHNKYANARGWIRMSAAYSIRTGVGDERRLTQRMIGEGLGLNADEDTFYIFRDHTGGLEYIRSGKELVEQGMYIELEAYKCHTFIDWREVRDDAFHTYGQLTGYLAGQGVPSVEDAVKEIFLQPLHAAFKELVNADLFRRLIDASSSGETFDELVRLDALDDQPLEDVNDESRLAGASTADVTADELTRLEALDDEAHDDLLDATHLVESPEVETSEVDAESTTALLNSVERKMLRFLDEINDFTGSGGKTAPIAREVRNDVAAILALPALGEGAAATAVEEALEALGDEKVTRSTLLGWAFVHAIGKLTSAPDYAEQSRSWMDEWLLGRILSTTLNGLGIDAQTATRAVAVVQQLTSHQDWFTTLDSAYPAQLVQTLLGSSELQQLLGLNRYQGVLWFDKAAFEQLLWWMVLSAVITVSSDDKLESSNVVGEAFALVKQLQEAAEASGYQVEKLLEGVQVAG